MTARVLVTGATGFLGGHLVEECARRGDRVRVLVRPGTGVGLVPAVPGIEVVRGDLTDPRSLPAAVRDVDVVLHAAARARDFGTRAQFWSANVTGTESLLVAARRAGVGRFVHVSSPSVVMSGEHQLDIDESTAYPAAFLNLYSASKAAAERAVLAANARDFITCALRPRGIWGPRDRAGAVPRLLVRLVRGTLPDLSGPEPVYASLCYCTNAARACRLAADSDRVGGRAYFVADAERSDVWALVARVAALFGAPPPRRRVHPTLLTAGVAVLDQLWRLPVLARRPPPISRYGLVLLTRSATYDTSAATRDFGYLPHVDQPTGLLRFKQWVDGIGGVEALAATAGPGRDGRRTPARDHH